MRYKSRREEVTIADFWIAMACLLFVPLLLGMLR